MRVSRPRAGYQLPPQSKRVRAVFDLGQHAYTAPSGLGEVLPIRPQQPERVAWRHASPASNSKRVFLGNGSDAQRPVSSSMDFKRLKF